MRDSCLRGVTSVLACNYTVLQKTRRHFVNDWSFAQSLTSCAFVWPPLWSNSQSSWIQIQRSGFDSRRYQIFWEVVGLERGPLSLVSAMEELLERKSSWSSIEIEITAVRDPPRWLRNTPLTAKVGTKYKFETKIYSYNCHNSGHYPSPYHLFKPQGFGDRNQFYLLGPTE
jgi:hypothetical protein